MQKQRKTNTVVPCGFLATFCFSAAQGQRLWHPISEKVTRNQPIFLAEVKPIKFKLHPKFEKDGTYYEVLDVCRSTAPAPHCLACVVKPIKTTTLPERSIQKA
jgi:hypothetical protein